MHQRTRVVGNKTVGPMGLGAMPFSPGGRHGRGWDMAAIGGERERVVLGTGTADEADIGAEVPA